jgi:hypothetical protein
MATLTRLCDAVVRFGNKDCEYEVTPAPLLQRVTTTIGEGKTGLPLPNRKTSILKFRQNVYQIHWKNTICKK